MLYWKLSVGVLAFAVLASAVPVGVGHSLAASAADRRSAAAPAASEASFPQASEDLFPRHGQRRAAERRKRSRAATCGSSGPAATTASGTRSRATASATFDLLKIVTSHPSQTYCNGQRCDRDSRWRWLGAVNEPCFEKPTAPIRNASASGSTCAAPIARPIRSRTRPNIPA